MVYLWIHSLCSMGFDKCTNTYHCSIILYFIQYFHGPKNALCSKYSSLFPSPKHLINTFCSCYFCYFILPEGMCAHQRQRDREEEREKEPSMGHGHITTRFPLFFHPVEICAQPVFQATWGETWNAVSHVGSCFLNHQAMGVAPLIFVLPL